MLVQDLINEIKLELNDETGATYTDTELLTYLREAYEFINFYAMSYNIDSDKYQYPYGFDTELSFYPNSFYNKEFIKQFVIYKALKRIGDPFVKMTVPNWKHQLFVIAKVSDEAN